MKKLIIPLVFALAGSGFVTFSYLDTFVIAKEYNIDLSGDSNFSFSFAELSEESKASSSSISSKSSGDSISNSSKNSSSIISSNTSTQSGISSESTSNVEPPVEGKYYEDLTKEQIAALFTEEVVFEAKKHYSDPDIYIDITTERFQDYCTYYAADIRIKSLAYLKAGLALRNGKPGENITAKTSELCKKYKGILAIDGDTYGSQTGGYVVRNGVTIRSSRNLRRSKPEDLAIYADGTFEIFNEREHTLDDIVSKGAYHVFSFGPGLVNDGKITVGKSEEVGTAATQNRNQRCSIGIISPLHYLFLVSDGRIKSSPGLSLYQIAQIMQSKHCLYAYNFDGGGSATMYMDDGTGDANGNGALVNYCTQELVKTNNLPEAPKIEERAVSDIVYIGKE